MTEQRTTPKRWTQGMKDNICQSIAEALGFDRKRMDNNSICEQFYSFQAVQISAEYHQPLGAWLELHKWVVPAVKAAKPTAPKVATMPADMLAKIEGFSHRFEIIERTLEGVGAQVRFIQSAEGRPAKDLGLENSTRLDDLVKRMGALSQLRPELDDIRNAIQRQKADHAEELKNIRSEFSKEIVAALTQIKALTDSNTELHNLLSDLVGPVDVKPAAAIELAKPAAPVSLVDESMPSIDKIKVKPALPRIAIVGLHGDEESVIRQKFSRIFDIEFVSHKKGEPELTARKCAGLRAIVMRSTIRNDAIIEIRKMAQSMIIVDLHKSTSEVSRILNNIITEEGLRHAS